RTAPVIARGTVTPPAHGPIPFDLEYDPNRIDPSHRYAVRARVSDSGGPLFTSADTVLAITQGHPSRVALTLNATGRSPVPSVPPASEPLMPSSDPVVELTALPATFKGTAPCDSCASLRYELALMPDDVFVLRRTWGSPVNTTKDVIGSWV